MRLEVCLTLKEYEEKYHNYIAVVIDVLRATTCIATGFTNQCQQIIPVKTVAEALALKQERYPSALLAGERQGLLIPGFNLGNSPYDYAAKVVCDKTIIITTTNGTMALNTAASAKEVYTAAFVNAQAVAQKITASDCDVVLVCSGTEGRFSLEDALCAGYLVELLASDNLSDTALATQAMYQNASKGLLSFVSLSSHSRYLETIGYQEDLAFCMRKDVFTVVPQFKDGILKV